MKNIFLKLFTAISFMFAMGLHGQATIPNEVNLSFGEVEYVTILPGGIFSIPVYVETKNLTAGIVAIDFILESSLNGSGYFHIVDRQLAPDTVFTNPTKPDSQISSELPSDGSVLAPRNGQAVMENGLSLGGTVDEESLGNNKFSLYATFKVKAAPNTPEDSFYIFSNDLYEEADSGVFNENEQEFKISRHDIIYITVPEPETFPLLLATGLLAFAAIRQFKK